MLRAENEDCFDYQVDKVRFVVTPIYNTSGEAIQTILEKLIMNEIETGEAS